MTLVLVVMAAFVAPGLPARNSATFLLLFRFSYRVVFVKNNYNTSVQERNGKGNRKRWKMLTALANFSDGKLLSEQFS